MTTRATPRPGQAGETGHKTLRAELIHSPVRYEISTRERALDEYDGLTLSRTTGRILMNSTGSLCSLAPTRDSTETSCGLACLFIESAWSARARAQRLPRDPHVPSLRSEQNALQLQVRLGGRQKSSHVIGTVRVARHTICILYR